MVEDKISCMRGGYLLHSLPLSLSSVLHSLTLACLSCSFSHSIPLIPPLTAPVPLTLSASPSLSALITLWVCNTRLLHFWYSSPSFLKPPPRFMCLLFQLSTLPSPVMVNIPHRYLMMARHIVFQLAVPVLWLDGNVTPLCLIINMWPSNYSVLECHAPSCGWIINATSVTVTLHKCTCEGEDSHTHTCTQSRIMAIELWALIDCNDVENSSWQWGALKWF